MANFELVCLDMDGTLLNRQHEISDYSRNTLRLLCGKGVRVAIVTGRSAVNTYKYINSLGLGQAEMFLITYNGTFCTRINATLPQPQPAVDIVFSYPLQTQHVRMLIDIAFNLGLVLQYYNAENGEIYACPQTDEHRERIGRYASLVGQQQVLLSSYEEAISRCSSQKVLIFTKDADQLIEHCKEELPAGLFHVIRGSPDPYFVEFLPVGVTKGFAVERLCQSVLNIDVANVVAIGDGDNDVEMIKAVGLGIAMVNGRDVLKESAKRTSAFSNDDDGAARELEEIFGLR